MKYYRDGRPFYESTGTTDKREAQRRWHERLGQIATGTHQGPQVERTTFDELVAGIRQDYQLNKRKSVQRLDEYIKHLSRQFQRLGASGITTDRIQHYVIVRQRDGAMNGTINRELSQTKTEVSRVAYLPRICLCF